jgi:transposase
MNKKVENLPVVNPLSAGIDDGSRTLRVAIDQNISDIREFGVYSQDLEHLCLWLVEKLEVI